MQNNKRVVITGMGIVSSLGSKIDTFWDNLINGRSGISDITYFDTTNFATKFAGQVKDFNVQDYIQPKEIRKLDKFLHYAIGATKTALADANLEINEENSDRIGALVGSGIGGMETLENQFRVLFERGPSKVSPFFIPMMISNMASGQLGIFFGIRGPNLSIMTACATGAHSIGEACHIIKRGEADVMIAGGTEAAITPMSVAGFCALRALSTKNDNPQEASRPFDKDRDGFVMSEGAGILILEDLEHAKKRGATIYGEIVGYGASEDAYHITMPDPEGKGASLAMNAAIKNAGITPDKIDYINAHGTATPVGDPAETKALKMVFKDHAPKLSVSSTKSMHGHCLGAAGAVESIVCTMAIKNGIVPPTINLDTPDPECDLNYTPNKAVERDMEYAMNNSFGFGGQNAVLIFKKYTN
ncbi:MAG: beta-ketoacyl-ACP synthase II [Armatimonadota bacterium]